MMLIFSTMYAVHFDASLLTWFKLWIYLYLIKQMKRDLAGSLTKSTTCTVHVRQ